METKRKNRIYRTIMLIIVVAVVTFVVTSVVNYDGTIRYIVTGNTDYVDEDLISKIVSELSSITALLEDKYIGDIDEDELIDGAVKGLVEALGDTYTTYYTAEELEDFETSTLGNYVGIGVYLTIDSENNTIIVLAPIEGSPAEEAGLQSGDIILAADGTEYDASGLSDLSTYIKGEAGTDVVLTVKRGEETFDVTITRGDVDIKYVSSTLLDDNIRLYLYINI